MRWIIEEARAPAMAIAVFCSLLLEHPAKVCLQDDVQPVGIDRRQRNQVPSMVKQALVAAPQYRNYGGKPFTECSEGSRVGRV